MTEPTTYPPQVDQQPKVQEPMTSAPAGGNKNANDVPFGDDGRRSWSTGLFSCFDEPETTVIAWCCPCIVYSQVKYRYSHLAEHGQPDPTHGGPVCNSDCLMSLGLQFCFHFSWLLQVNTLSQIRQRYNIRGSTVRDALSAYFCVPCTLVRQSRELGFEEQSFAQQSN